jgi:hypothetical protein
MYAQIDSPPVPVAEGSPTWARKSLETNGDGGIRLDPHETVVTVLTIEEGVEIVVIDFAEFEKIFAYFWA